MYSIIFFVVTLFVVNASVVVVNVYDDDPETQQLENNLEDRFSLETCNNQECDQRCRRLKFPGGVCVNGRCKCDNFLRETDLEDRSSPQSCNIKECDQRCRILKFRGGVCVNGRCKCNNFLRFDGFLLDSQYEDNNENFTPHSCNYQECDQRCRRLKFPGGACVNGRCKCDNFLNTEDFVTYLRKSIASHICNYQDCNHQCQKCGYAGGVCVNNRCRCNYPRIIKGDVTNSIQYTLESLGSIQGLKCNPELNKFCDRICRILKYDDGTCVNGTCKCFNKDSDISNEIPNQSQEDQNHDELPPTEEYSNDPTEPAISHLYKSELHDNVIENRASTCNVYRCRNECRALQYSRGVCKNGKCYCYS